MKRLFSILSAFLLLFWSCEKSEDVLPEQQSKIVSYMTSTHTPKLISEQDKASSEIRNPEFYTPYGDISCRYIRHFYDEERLQYPEVAYGDRLSITFRMYGFDFKDILYYPKGTQNEITGPYYSNDPVIEQTMYEAGLTQGAWKFEPLEIDLGRTEILKGLEFALPGCRERDTVEVYMTYNMAYGEGPFGIIPKQTPIAVFFTVDKVTKN